MGSMKVVPAILPKTVEELKDPLGKLAPHFDSFQIDITDEAFVSQNTLGVEDIVSTIMAYPKISFDFHLMVFDFGRIINYLRNYTTKIKIGRVFVHHKAMPPKTLFDPVPGPFIIGLVINPEEEVKQLSTVYSFKKIAAIQIMAFFQY
jgi:pentose-5-phosphate-3-epimerase